MVDRAAAQAARMRGQCNSRARIYFLKETLMFCVDVHGMFRGALVLKPDEVDGCSH
jgi:hypothetical protein